MTTHHHLEAVEHLDERIDLEAEPTAEAVAEAHRIIAADRRATARAEAERARIRHLRALAHSMAATHAPRPLPPVIEAKRTAARLTMMELARQVEAITLDTGETKPGVIADGTVDEAGQSAREDLAKHHSYEAAAIPLTPGDPFKMALAESVNLSTFHTYSGHLEARRDGSGTYRRPTTEQPNVIGTIHQQDHGDRFVAAVVIEHQENAEHAHPTSASHYVIRGHRTYLDRSPRSFRLWKILKPGQKFRTGAWIWEPTEYLPADSADEAEHMSLFWHVEASDLDPDADVVSA